MIPINIEFLNCMPLNFTVNPLEVDVQLSGPALNLNATYAWINPKCGNYSLLVHPDFTELVSVNGTNLIVSAPSNYASGTYIVPVALYRVTDDFFNAVIDLLINVGLCQTAVATPDLLIPSLSFPSYMEEPVVMPFSFFFDPACTETTFVVTASKYVELTQTSPTEGFVTIFSNNVTNVGTRSLIITPQTKGVTTQMVFSVTFVSVCEEALIFFRPQMTSFVYELRSESPLILQMPFYRTEPPGCEDKIEVDLESRNKFGSDIPEPSFMDYDAETMMATI